MNQMEVFNNPEFGSVRIIEENGSYLFSGLDVATHWATAILGPQFPAIAGTSRNATYLTPKVPGRPSE